MYISRFLIRNFRGIKEADLTFRKGLNALIGENNCGKTSVIDALRLVLNVGSMRRDISLSHGDFFRDNQGIVADQIEFVITFAEINSIERGVFCEMLVEESGESYLQLHVRYLRENRSGIERWRFKYWGGSHEGQQVAPEVLELFYSVSLGALRDASSDLSPGRGNRLGQLFLKLKEDPRQQELYASRLQTIFDEDEEWNSLRRLAETKIKEHLDKTSFEDYRHDVKISFVPLEFKRIAENLQMQIRNAAEATSNLFDVEQNGLGYNNLLYIATVLGDLLERKNIEPETSISLFIEEPEAHLHPQLQDTLFNFLVEIANTGIQIFLTSHSPIITAKAPLDSLTILHLNEGRLDSLSISNCPIETEHRKHLERFLDVTKAQLFFSRGVLLVEGISEALLMSLFAKKGDYDLDKRGIEIVNIAGTAFEPFARLFIGPEINRRLCTRCSVITDDDSHISGSISARASRIRALESGMLKVFLGRKTFEHELIESGNLSILTDVYQEMHPRTSIASADEFMNALNINRDKAELAQLLALRLATNTDQMARFVVPEYINLAINWVIEGTA